MEDVLAVYTRPRDPDMPLVCLDETSKQLIAETRAPIKMKEGRPVRLDYEHIDGRQPAEYATPLRQAQDRLMYCEALFLSLGIRTKETKSESVGLLM